MLTIDELEFVRRIIASRPDGEYDLKGLFGAEWQFIQSPTTFGRKFKAAVLSGRLPQVSHVSIRTDNHNMYRVSK